MTRRSRRLVPAFIGLVSAGWTIPACYGIASYFRGIESWLFSIRTSGSVYKTSRLLDANIEFAVAMIWLGFVVLGWAAYGAARVMRSNELPNSTLQPLGAGAPAADR